MTEHHDDHPDNRKVELRKEDERRWRRVFTILYALVVFTLAVGGFTYYLSTQDEKQNKIDKERTVELEGITRGLRQAVRDIQQSRIEITREACEEQNRRHDRTIRRLNRLIVEAKRRDPARAAEITRSSKGSILLIDALQPHQDCAALIEKRFG